MSKQDRAKKHGAVLLLAGMGSLITGGFALHAAVGWIALAVCLFVLAWGAFEVSTRGEGE